MQADRYEGNVACWPAEFGDLDQDGDVDLNDFSIFAGCMMGPGVVYPGGCDYADMDDDLDVDLADFAGLQASFPGV